MSTQPRTSTAPRFATTVFHDRFAKTFAANSLSMEQLASLVQTPTAPDKKDLPLLKGAIFGDTRSDEGSLRHDLNVLEISGVEIDYDGEVMPFEDAAERLRKANIECVMYTSPSYTVEKPRFRVVARLSVPIKPTRKMKPERRANILREARAKYVSRLDAVLGFVAANESYALSQSYFFGGIKGGSPVDVRVIEGRCVDKCKELDKFAKPKAANPKAANPKAANPPVVGKRPYRADMTDQQILDDYAFPSKHGDRLKRLLGGDITGYPSASEADLACASDLAYWFWGDPVSIENVMRDSELFREKWDTNKRYLERTIAKALSGDSNYYGKEVDRPDTSAQDVPEPKGKSPKGKKASNGSTPPDPEKFDYKLHMRSAQDLIDNPPPPIKYLVQDLFACGASVLLVGKPKSFKTWLAMQIALALCGNSGFLSDWALFGKITKSYRVAIIDFEQSEAIAAQMMARFDVSTVKGLIRINKFPKLDTAGLDELRKLIKEQKLDAVIIDSWTRAAPPPPARSTGVFQNEGDSMQAVTNVAHETGCLILTIAHGGKRDAADDPMQMIAGTNALTASVDDVVVLFKDGEDEGRTVRRKLFVSGRNIAKHGTYILEKGDLDACFVLKGDAESVVRGETKRRILALLGGGAALSPTDLAKSLGGRSRSQVHTALQKLVDERHVVAVGGGKYQKLTDAATKKILNRKAGKKR